MNKLELNKAFKTVGVFTVVTLKLLGLIPLAWPFLILVLCLLYVLL